MKKDGDELQNNEWLEEEELVQDIFADQDEGKIIHVNAVRERLGKTESAEETAEPDGLEEAEEAEDFYDLEDLGELDDLEAAAEGFDEEDDRDLKNAPKDKKKVLIGLAALCLVALVAFFFSDRFFNMIQGRSSYTLRKMEQQVTFAEGNTQVLLSDGGEVLLRCSRDGLQALNEDGQVDWDIPFTMSSPYMLQAGDFIAVADRLGTGLLLVEDGAVRTELTTEKQILLHCINEVGSTAVVLDGGDSHTVNLYGATGEMLMQRYTYAKSDGIPVALALNEDGSRMATAYIYYTGTKLQSIVTIFDLTEMGSALVDRIVGSAAFEDCVISDLRFDGKKCFFAGSDRFGVLEAGEACEIVWEKQLEYQMDTLVMTDSYFAVRYGEGLAGTVTAAENNIVTYDYSGDMLYEMNIEGADYLDAWGDTLICGVGRLYYGMSAKGSPKWQVDADEAYSRLIAFDGDNTVAALRNGQLNYYEVAIKNGVQNTDE